MQTMRVGEDPTRLARTAPNIPSGGSRKRGFRMWTIKRLGSWLPVILFLSPGQSASPEEKAIEPKAEQVLREMADYLTGSSALAFKAEASIDEFHETGLKIQTSARRTMAVRRPDRAASNLDGDRASRSAWYDGKTISVLDKRHNTYSVLEAPDSLDAALDFLAEEYDIVLPLADFVRDDVYESLSSAANFGVYVGLHEVDGVLCHHLAFANDFLEWQIWVDAGKEPLPRKMVINYKDEPGEPQFTARFLSWNLSAELPDDLFQFTPPEGAQELKPESMASRIGLIKEEKP